MLYMVIEHFKDGAGVAGYRRFRDRGRMSPPGLEYVSSWVETGYARCFQVMLTDHPGLLDEWMIKWSDLIDFEVIEVLTSQEAATSIAPRLQVSAWPTWEHMTTWARMATSERNAHLVKQCPPGSEKWPSGQRKMAT